jgi:hypothetical protein
MQNFGITLGKPLAIFWDFSGFGLQKYGWQFEDRLGAFGEYGFGCVDHSRQAKKQESAAYAYGKGRSSFRGRKNSDISWRIGGLSSRRKAGPQCVTVDVNGFKPVRGDLEIKSPAYFASTFFAPIRFRQFFFLGLQKPLA